MSQHPTQGHKNNSHKPGSHRHTVANESARPEWGWMVQETRGRVEKVALPGFHQLSQEKMKPEGL